MFGAVIFERRACRVALQAIRASLEIFPILAGSLFRCTNGGGVRLGSLQPMGEQAFFRSADGQHQPEAVRDGFVLGRFGHFRFGDAATRRGALEAT